MRPSEIMPLPAEDSRCGEIFVSNKADKWTFYCSYCQKGTSDIGVFVCHIRLDHLDSLLDFENQKGNVVTAEEEENFPETDSQPIDALSVRRDGDNERDISLIKEETLSQYSYASELDPTNNSKNLDISIVNNSNEIENTFPAKVYILCTFVIVFKIQFASSTF